jgi:hypothetical protein
MSISRPRVASRGFALVELAAVVLTVLGVFVAAALLLPDARRRAMLAVSIQNLKQLGAASSDFAADKSNRIHSLDWAPGPASCGDYAFPVSVTYYEAAAMQAICILRERAGRTDFVAVSGWFPYGWYNHLVLTDYLDDTFPSSKVVSPGDAPRLAWQRSLPDPANYLSLTCRPGGTTGAESRVAYSSSYEMVPAAYSPDARFTAPDGIIVPTIQQDPMGHRYWQPGSSRTVLGHRRLDEVRFPSAKVFLHESNDRFYDARQPYFLYPEARVPVALFDGSVSVRSINQANQGFQPNLPNSSAPTRVNYVPDPAWETPPLRGGLSEFIYGAIRWTRSGLRGRDFAGPEVPWAP